MQNVNMLPNNANNRDRRNNATKFDVTESPAHIGILHILTPHGYRQADHAARVPQMEMVPPHVPR